MIDFIERNKNRFIFAASLVGGVYAFTIYVKLKLAEIIKDRDDEKLSSALYSHSFNLYSQTLTR